MNSKYENDRLVAMTKFVKRLTTSKYHWDNISDEVADISSEVADIYGHVITQFDQIGEDFTRSTNFYFYDVPTEKVVKVSFEYEDLEDGENEV